MEISKTFGKLDGSDMKNQAKANIEQDKRKPGNIDTRPSCAAPSIHNYTMFGQYLDDKSVFSEISKMPGGEGIPLRIKLFEEDVEVTNPKEMVLHGKGSTKLEIMKNVDEGSKGQVSKKVII